MTMNCKGLFYEKISDKNVKTEKMIIIGPSMSGKTEQAVNLLIWEFNNYNGIIWVCPEASWNCNALNMFKEICLKANMPLFHLDSEKIEKTKKSLVLPEVVGPSVYVIDDCYTSTGRDRDIENFVKSTITRGRHLGRHIIYISQLAYNLPYEVLDHNTAILLSNQIAKKESTYSIDVAKDIKKKPPFNNILQPIPKNINDLNEFENYPWFIYDKQNQKLNPLVFKPKSKTQIIQNMNNKLEKNLRKIKISRDREKKLIALQGNQLAAKPEKAEEVGGAITNKTLMSLFN